MTNSVPYVVHESSMVRMERANRRLFITCIILIVSLIASNIGWLVYESQYEYFETQRVEQEVDTGDGNATVIGIGNYNGESEADNHDQ